MGGGARQKDKHQQEQDSLGRLWRFFFEGDTRQGKSCKEEADEGHAEAGVIRALERARDG